MRASLPTGAAIASGLGWYSLSGSCSRASQAPGTGASRFFRNAARAHIVFHYSLIAKHLNYPHRPGGSHERTPRFL
ncbi:MAG: LysO family transporter [Eggerthellaceae bacterium]